MKKAPRLTAEEIEILGACKTPSCLLHQGMCADPVWRRITSVVLSWEDKARHGRHTKVGSLYTYLIETTLLNPPWTRAFPYHIEALAAAIHENTRSARGALDELVYLDMLLDRPLDSVSGTLTWNVRLRKVYTPRKTVSSTERLARQHLRAELRPRVKLAVLRRDRHTCVYCGQPGGQLEIDHVVPLSRGGTNDINNLVTACYDCNRAKHAKTPEEWRA